MPTDAAINCDTMRGDPLRINWRYRLGSTWSSEELAVTVDGQPVELGQNGWVALAQARYGDVVVAQWSTEDDTIVLGHAEVDGVTTSTITCTHTPKQSRSRGPFGPTPIEVEVSQYAPDAAPGDDPLVSYPVAAGFVEALPDGAHR